MRTDQARGRAILLALVPALLCLGGCDNSPSDPVTRIQTTLHLTGTSPAKLRQELDAGSWLIELLEPEMDFRTSVTLGGQTSVLSNSFDRVGRTYYAVTVPKRSELAIELVSRDHNSIEGEVRIRFARFRRALMEKPATAELGYAAWSRAGILTALEDPESQKKADKELALAMDLFARTGDQSARGWVAMERAYLEYHEIEDWSVAFSVLDAADQAFRLSGDELGSQLAAHLRGAVEIEYGDSLNPALDRQRQVALQVAAERRLAKTAEYFYKHEPTDRAADAFNLLGVSATHRGAEELATQHFARALQLARARRDGAHEIKALMNLAWMHRLNGEVARAAEEYASLLPLIDPARKPYMYAVALNNYGYCSTALGDFDRALQLHTQSMEYFTKTGDREEALAQLQALGSLYYRMGNPHRALESLRAAIVELQKSNANNGLAIAFRRAGIAAAALGDHALALEYLRHALKSDIGTVDIDRTRIVIAGELRTIGDLQGAEAELATALRSPNPLVRTDALAALGRVRLARGKLAAAIADMRAADTAYGQLGLDTNRIDNKVALSQASLANHELAMARTEADDAIELVTRIRTKSGNPEWRAQFLSASYLPFEARIAVELAGDAPPDEKAWRTFRIAEDVRARSLADLRARGPGVGDQSDAEGDILRARVTALQVRLESRLQSASADEERTQALRRALIEVRAQFDAHQASRSATAVTHTPLPVTLAEFQSALPADTAVLAYFVGDGASHGWLITRNRIRHATLPARQAMEKLIADFVSELRRGARGSAQTRIRAVTGDLLSEVSEPRLLILPDGALHGLPFAALPWKGSDGQLLVDRFVISTPPSLTLAKNNSPVRDLAKRRIAVISDPVYTLEDRRMKQDTPVVVALRNPAGSSLRLTRLSYSAREARAVAGAFEGANVIELNGFDATADRVMQLPRSGLDVLHFATHARSRRDAPEQSALFLSEFAQDGSPVTFNRLTVSDVARSGLRADVVVLSGCATGEGRELRGEGVLGLAYAFMANGSRSVVASLWPVEDASTTKFMEEFYAAYRVSGDAADALRNAQLRVRGGSAAAAWPSFVVRSSGMP